MSGVLSEPRYPGGSGIGNMDDYINNRATIVAYKESIKDPPGFFSGFNEEIAELIFHLIRDNPRKLSLFSYSMMMKAIGRSSDVIEVDFLMSADRPLIRVRNPSVNGGVSIRLDPIVSRILHRVCKILSKHFQITGRHRLLFTSFQAYSYNATRWPVLPWEWLKKNGILTKAMRTLRWHEAKHYQTKQQRGHLRAFASGWAHLFDYFDAQLSFRCDMSTGYNTDTRLCMRHPDAALESGDVIPVNSLIHMARECGMPDALSTTPRYILCDALQKYQPLAIALDLFMNYFRDELLESLRQYPRYFMLLKGGYNLKLLLEDKFGYNHRIFTTDLDFGVSSNNARWSMERTIRFWEERLADFIDLSPDTRKSFTIQKTRISNPEERDNLVMIMQIRYNGSDFVDLSFTTSGLPRSKIDLRLSKKIGLPVQKWSFAVVNLFDLVVRENYPGLDPHTYERRNPIHRTAINRDKGIRDLYRARTVCEAMRKHPHLHIENHNQLERLCAIISNRLSMSQLTAMTEKQRRVFFARLAKALGYII